MSQIYKSGVTGPSPPEVPTQFTADDATTAVPVANNLNLFSRDTRDDNDNGIQTTADPNGSDDFYVELTNRITGTASVTGAVTGEVFTFDLGGSAAVYRFEILCTGRDTATGDGVGYTVDASVKTDGASGTVIKTPFIDSDEDDSLSAALIDVVASGNNAILRVTGVAGQTITYNAVGSYIKV